MSQPDHICPGERTCLVSLCLVIALLTGCPEDPLPIRSCDLSADDLLITEIMYYPESSEFEWFEIYNNTDKPQLLRKLRIQAGNKTIREEGITKNVEIKPGEHFLVGVGRSQGDGGPALAFDHIWDIGSPPMVDGGGSIILTCGKQEVTRVTYKNDVAGWPKRQRGKAIQLSRKVYKTSGTRAETKTAGAAANWCLSSKTYTAGRFGSPGADNEGCNQDTCAHPPRAGDLVINELMPNGPGAEDKVKEWIEVYVAGAAKDNKVDFKGLEVFYGKTTSATPHAEAISGTGCMTASVGQYVLLGRKSSSGTSCSVTPRFSFEGSGIVNDGGTVGLRLASDKKVLAKASYTKSTDGAAFNRDEATGMWCASTVKFCSDSSSKKDGLGTPGKKNTACH